MKGNSLFFLMLWLVLFVSGCILSTIIHPSLTFFTIGFGLTSIVTLAMLWWSGTGEISKTAKSVLISMVAISLKMFACAIIFIYYFHHHKEEMKPAVLSGSLMFLAFTSLEVAFGLKMAKSSDNTISNY